MRHPYNVVTSAFATLMKEQIFPEVSGKQKSKMATCIQKSLKKVCEN